MPYKTFADGSLFTAADVNSYLMRQTVIRVATIADRDAIAPEAGLQVWVAADGITYLSNGSTWTMVGGDTGWVTATYQNLFSTLAGYSQVKYRRLNGVVHVRGVVTRGSAPAAGTTVFNLPVGFRPAIQMLAPVVIPSTSTYCGITSGGDVQYKNGWSSWMSFDGLSFPAEI